MVSYLRVTSALRNLTDRGPSQDINTDEQGMLLTVLVADATIYDVLVGTDSGFAFQMPLSHGPFSSKPGSHAVCGAASASYTHSV